MFTAVLHRRLTHAGRSLALPRWCSPGPATRDSRISPSAVGHAAAISNRGALQARHPRHSGGATRKRPRVSQSDAGQEGGSTQIAIGQVLRCAGDTRTQSNSIARRSRSSVTGNIPETSYPAAFISLIISEKPGALR